MFRLRYALSWRRVVGGLLSYVLLTVASLSVAKTRPNIVIIFTDDIGYGDVSCLNPENGYKTPAIDRLAAEGIVFHQAHSTAAVCAPSRYAVLTGNYVYRGFHPGGVWVHCKPSQILPGQMTLAGVLKEHGYRSAFLGKLHLGGQFYGRDSDDPVSMIRDADLARPMFDGPMDHGFDYSLTLPAGIQHSPYAFFENDRLSRWDAASNRFTYFDSDQEARRYFKHPVGEGPPVESLTNPWNEKHRMDNFDTRQVGPILTFKALEFVQSHVDTYPDRPFFMHFCTEAAHSPFTPPVDLSPSDPDDFDRKGDYPVAGMTPTLRSDMVYQSDVMVRALVEELGRLGILENTIFIYTSDNGAAQYRCQWDEPKYNTFKWGAFGGNRIDRDDNREGFVKNPQGIGVDGRPLKGQKGDIYEGGHRVPLVIRAGRNVGSKLKRGVSSQQLVASHDLFATLCELADVKIPSGQALDSLSFADVLTGERSEDNPVREWLQAQGRVPVSFEQTKAKQMAERGGFKTVLREDGMIIGLEGKRAPKTNRALSSKLEKVWMGRALYHQVKGKRWKLVVATNKHDVAKDVTAWEFYELTSDPDESNNLIRDPEHAMRIEAMLQEYADQVSRKTTR